jgi:hypothetical protein
MLRTAMLSTARLSLIYGYTQTYQHYPQACFHKTGVPDVLSRQYHQVMKRAKKVG